MKITKTLERRILSSVYATDFNYKFLVKSHSSFGRSSQENSEKLLNDIINWANKYGVKIDIDENLFLSGDLKPSKCHIIITIRDHKIAEIINKIINTRMSKFYVKPKKFKHSIIKGGGDWS